METVVDIAFAMGSGRRGRSYLFERQGVSFSVADQLVSAQGHLEQQLR